MLPFFLDKILLPNWSPKTCKCDSKNLPQKNYTNKKLKAFGGFFLSF